MSGFWTRPRWTAPGAVLGALVCALLGAAGLGPNWPSGARNEVVLADASASCAPAKVGAPFEHSDLLRAVREAVSRGARRVVLHTDGCDTTGQAATNPGVPVYVVLRPRRDNVGVYSLHVPTRIAPGAPFSIRVQVGRTAGSGDSVANIAVRLSRDGEAIGSAQSMSLLRGANRSVTFVDVVPQAGVVHYRVHIEGGPGGTDDDHLEAVARVGVRTQVAVLGPAPAWQDEFEFTALRDGMSLDGFDAIVLAEPPTPAMGERIEQAVRRGAGLLVIGNPAPLGSLLPLTDDPPDGRAVVVLVDVSGSMERHLDAIRSGFLDLAGRLAPTDRVALILFRDRVVRTSEWVPAPQAKSLWKSVAARGSTRLEPAARAAFELLTEAQARYRRLYVVSDGEWGDNQSEALAGLLRTNATVHQAALFVNEEAPLPSRALFPIHAASSAGPIESLLLRLESQAPDRWVRDEVRAQLADAPGWFAGAIDGVVIEGGGRFKDFPRLYPRGAGESIVLAADSIPIVAVRTEGGRIVQAAQADAVGPAALRACIRDDPAVDLHAMREGRSVVFTARGSAGAPFRVGDRIVAARAVGADHWEARLSPAPPRTFVVECAGATRVVAAAASVELAGLHPNEEFAAALARISGGRFARGDVPDQWTSEWTAGASARAAASVTLLAAALLVLAAAFLRRAR